LPTDDVGIVGKQPNDGIVLDASHYPSNLRIPGIEDTNNAYDALNSALAVNFNTIDAVRRGNKVSSGEKQTPITPLAIAQFRERGPKGSSRISLSQDPTVSLQYAGELIAAFIKRAGGSVKGKISTGTVPEGLKPVYVHRQSRPLSKMKLRMLLTHRKLLQSKAIAIENDLRARYATSASKLAQLGGRGSRHASRS